MSLIVELELKLRPFIWRNVAPGRKVIRILGLPWASQLIRHFLTKRGGPFTSETKRLFG